MFECMKEQALGGGELSYWNSEEQNRNVQSHTVQMESEAFGTPEMLHLIMRNKYLYQAKGGDTCM